MQTDHYIAAVINRPRDIEMELANEHEKCKVAKAFDAKANAAAAEAKSKVEVVETKVAHLKKALEEAEAEEGKDRG